MLRCAQSPRFNVLALYASARRFSRASPLGLFEQPARGFLSRVRSRFSGFLVNSKLETRDSKLTYARIQNKTLRKINRAAMRIALLAICSAGISPSQAHGSSPTVAGYAGVLMETGTGKIFWQRNEDIPLAPASTTKILTALVVLERSKVTDHVKVPAEATRATGGSARLHVGERLSVEQLLYGMMLGSGNDAAVALASHTGGSVGRFVGLMNEKARELDARRSSFRNPTGLPQEGHLATARDLGVITRAALANPNFRKIVATPRYAWRSAGWRGELKNSNLLLQSYPGAIGVKTGQTREAGFCLVAAAARVEKSLIAVILKSTEKSGWHDAKALLDYGFRDRAK
jgi:D-alanyl-D-alanine carboxypeptidase (penicillin-binding protein 5/6)